MGSSDDQNSSGSSSSDSPPSDSSSSSQSPPSSSSSSSPSPPSSDSGSSSNSGSSPPKDSSSSNGGSSSSSPPSDSGSSSSGNSGSSPPSNSGSSSSGNSGSSPPSNSGSSSSGNSGSSPPSDSGSSSSSNSGNSGSSPPSDSGSSSGNSGNSGSSPPSNNNNSNNSPPSNSNSNNSNNNSNNNNGNGGSNNGGNSNDNSNGGNSNNNNNNGGSNNNNNGSNNNNNNSNNNNGSNNNNQQKSPPSNHGNNNNQNQNNNNQNQNNNNNNQNNNNNNHQSRSSHGNSPPKSSDDFSPPAIGSGKSHKSDNSSPPSSGSSSTPVIVGVVAAAGFLLLVIVLFFLACSKRRKKRQTSSHLMENPDPYHPNGSDYWQSGPKGGDHVLNMPPSGRAPNGGWTAGAPPPMVSSEIASSNFSGPHGPPLPPPHPNVAFGFNKSTFTYEELSAATSGFAQSKLLGQGGFGYVHKGVLPNGKEIAVKSLKAGSGQGDREFGAEVEIISRVHHRHLVSLVGYCLSGERKLLVYEYVPNNNLEFHLHGQNGSSPLEWSNRIKIALGSAKGLAYLHEDCHPKIIHRDIKAANILIDYSFEAKVADFGLAKLNQENVTHVSTRVMGTFGYLAPEYASSGKLTEKSDVFSFGIMLLELITGRRPVDMSADSEEDTLVDWARPRCLKAIDTGDYSEVLDPRLESVNQEEVARMVACAAASVRHSAKKRPKMSQIVRALEGDVSMEDLHEGIKGTLGSSSTSLASSEFDTDSYNAKMKGLRKPALMDSTDYPSSEYGATNDYGHHSGSSGEMDNKKGMNRPRGPA